MSMDVVTHRHRLATCLMINKTTAAEFQQSVVCRISTDCSVITLDDVVQDAALRRDCLVPSSIPRCERCCQLSRHSPSSSSP